MINKNTYFVFVLIHHRRRLKVSSNLHNRVWWLLASVFSFSFAPGLEQKEGEVKRGKGIFLVMAPSFDLAVSNLLCAEENCIFDNNDGDDETVVEEFVMAPYYLRTGRNRNYRRGGGGEGLPFMSDECLIEMVEKEAQHLPVDGYLVKLQNGELDVGARKEAVDWIEKVGGSLLVESRFRSF